MDDSDPTQPNNLGEWYEGFVAGRFAEANDLARGLGLVLGRQGWSPDEVDAFLVAVREAAKENR